MLVHVVADYGPGDLGEGEVAQRLKLLLPDAEPLYTPPSRRSPPGSSGWTRADGTETRWVELFLRGGSAWEAFDRPDIGARVEIYS